MKLAATTTSWAIFSDYFYMHHSIVHDLCYPSCGALVGTRTSSDDPLKHEGVIYIL